MLEDAIGEGPSWAGLTICFQERCRSLRCRLPAGYASPWSKQVRDGDGASRAGLEDRGVKGVSRPVERTMRRYISISGSGSLPSSSSPEGMDIPGALEASFLRFYCLPAWPPRSAARTPSPPRPSCFNVSLQPAQQSPGLRPPGSSMAALCGDGVGDLFYLLLMSPC